MSWTVLEYRLHKFYFDHQYDAFAKTGKVGLGRCKCGEEMYYCDHSTHFARALIAELQLDAYPTIEQRVKELEERDYAEHRRQMANDKDWLT